MATGSNTHSSLIQGISQQAPHSRGSASCEYQENCLNEVLDGVVSRMGSTVVADYPWFLEDPMIHEISRDRSERYLIILSGSSAVTPSPPPELRIINRESGVEATITGDISAYLEHSGPTRTAFQAVTVGDTTFLLNRQRVVEVGSEKSPQRPNLGCAYFRAGGYKITYRLTIVLGEQSWSAEYETPDNSATDNAEYIATNHLASQFKLALDTTVFPAMEVAGHPGFTCEVHASTLIIAGPAGKSFLLRTSDGAGDTHLRAFVDTVDSVADLPRKCQEGYIVAVAPPGTPDGARYWLEYRGDTDTGRWVEVVAPDTVLDLDAGTMPHILVNTAPNTFEARPGVWGQRVSGDGDKSSPDPSFVGQPIRALQFISGRLAAVSEYTMVLSRARNAYVYFPDTAQTNLDTAPVDYDVSNGSSTNIEHSVVAGGRLQFWGDGQQTYLDTGNEAIKEDTTEVLPLANYEFDGECPPRVAGSASLLFSTAIGPWSKITEVLFQRSQIAGEITITAHVPRLLMGAVRDMAVGQAAAKALVRTEGSPSSLYLYQWYNQGDERVQSAWNVWTFPAASGIIWAGIQGSTATLLVSWGATTTLEKIRLDAQGDEPQLVPPLRLDHRLSENYGTFGDGRWTFTLPFAVPPDRQALFRCFERSDIGGNRRGREVPVEWTTPTTLEVLSSNPALECHLGVVPVARRTSSLFLARSPQDEPVVHDRLVIYSVAVSHKDTAEYDIVVHPTSEPPRKSTFAGRIVGDTAVQNRDVARATGSHEAKVNLRTEEVEIELVNSTPFPCIWASMKYDYEITVRKQ